MSMIGIARFVLGRTPLGWLQLVHSPMRFAMASAGVGFAVILVFMQLGFMNMLFDTSVMFHKLMKGDIVVTNVTSREFNGLKSFGRRTLIKALGVPGVVDVSPVYVATVSWINPATKDKRNILVIGVEPGFQAFTDPALNQQLYKLQTMEAAIFDRGSRGDFKEFIRAIDADERPTVEVGGVTVSFEGTFKLGSSFGVEATMIVSDSTFKTLVPSQSVSAINLGLVQLEPGVDANAKAQEISDYVEDVDAAVRTQAGFVAHTRDFMSKESPIAYIFGFGVVMGLAVGVIVCVQILSTDVQDHLPEYATFKAMGFTNGAIRSIVVEQSAILTVFGFLPGFALSLGLYAVVRMSVSMPISMPMSRVWMVLGLTIAMCMISGIIALQRVAKADPAEVF